MDKFLRIVSDIAEKAIPIVSVLCALFVTLSMTSGDESQPTYYLAIIFLVLIIEFVALIIMRRVVQKQKSDVNKLEKWIEYGRKRKEIEEQMDRLYAELSNSSMSDYIDLNRLIFSGQSDIFETQVHYNESFLRQFGLDKDRIKVKQGSAVFLTPFNAVGDRLYRKCQQVLSDLGVLLRRSDNYVEKEDVLMNIISLIVQSEFVVANIDGRNPNVYYEIGIAHALGKPTILISRRKGKLVDADFDIRQKRIVLYDSYEDLESKLLYQISMLKTQVQE